MQNKISIYFGKVRIFNYFAVLYEKYEKIKNLRYRVVLATLEREPAFSVGHF